MSDLEVAFHKRWLGMLEPIEGLVVSLPVLVEAECMHRQGPELSQRLAPSVAELHQELGRSPSVDEVAVRVGLSREQVLEAIRHSVGMARNRRKFNNSDANKSYGNRISPL